MKQGFQTFMNFHGMIEIKCSFQWPSSSDSPLTFWPLPFPISSIFENPMVVYIWSKILKLWYRSHDLSPDERKWLFIRYEIQLYNNIGRYNSSIQSTAIWYSNHCQMALQSVPTSNLLEPVVKQKWVVTARGRQPVEFVF